MVSFFRIAAALLLVAGVASCSKRETPVDAGLRTKTLHIGNSAEPRDLDPHIAVAYTDYNILMALFEGLTVIDEATSQPLPGIAQSWDISPDGRVYTFHLRDSRWSNGDPVTAEDFAFSIQRILTPKLAAEYGNLLYSLEGAEAYHLGKMQDFSTVGVKVLNPRTLQLTLTRPTPYFLSIVAHQTWFPVHQASLAKVGDPLSRNTGWTKPGTLVSNGAFSLEEWVPDQRVVVKKSPMYWGASNNRIERVAFYPIASAKVEEANFRTGQLHITYEVLPERISTFQKEDARQVRVDPLLETFFLRFNVTKPPFQDKRVRQALARAIDREAIAHSVMRGSRVPAYFLTPPNTAGYTCTAKIPTDYAAARKLLAEAGYPDGKGFPKVDVQMNTDPINTVIVEAIQQMWRKELGIEVGIVQQEFRVYLDNQHTLHYDISRSRWVGDFNDPTTFIDLFASYSGNNDTGWKNADYDRLIEEASHLRDNQARFERLQQAEALLLEEAPIAPVFFGTRTYLIKPMVKGWVPSLLGIHRYQTLWLE